LSFNQFRTIFLWLTHFLKFPKLKCQSFSLFASKAVPMKLALHIANMPFTFENSTIASTLT
jgi:hypothetical protein